MPRRTQKEAVAERTQHPSADGLAEKASRRGRRKAADAGAETAEQAKPKRAAREKAPRKERKPRVHANLLTVAFRGPLAGKFREMADRYQMSLAALLQDALLAYESHVATGYQPGAALTEWKAQQTVDAGSA